MQYLHSHSKSKLVKSVTLWVSFYLLNLFSSVCAIWLGLRESCNHNQDLCTLWGLNDLKSPVLNEQKQDIPGKMFWCQYPKFPLTFGSFCEINHRKNLGSNVISFTTWIKCPLLKVNYPSKLYFSCENNDLVKN